MADAGLNGGAPPELCVDHTKAIQTNATKIVDVGRDVAITRAVLSGQVLRCEKKLDRLIEAVKIGAIVPAEKANLGLEYDSEDPTNPGVIGVSEWANRARKAAVMLSGAKQAETLAIARERRATIVAVCTGAVAILGALGALARVIFGG